MSIFVLAKAQDDIITLAAVFKRTSKWQNIIHKLFEAYQMAFSETINPACSRLKFKHSLLFFLWPMKCFLYQLVIHARIGIHYERNYFLPVGRKQYKVLKQYFTVSLCTLAYHNSNAGIFLMLACISFVLFTLYCIRVFQNFSLLS